MKRLLFFIIIFYPFILCCQNYCIIKGRILDSRSDNPITEAHIYCSDFRMGTISNQLGDFVIKLPVTLESIILTISHVNYGINTLEIKASDSSFHYVRLTAKPIVISEMTIYPITVKQIFDSIVFYMKRNYPENPMVLQAFYREKTLTTSKPSSSFEGKQIIESVININKQPIAALIKDIKLTNEVNVVANRTIETAGQNNLPLMGFFLQNIVNSEILVNLKDDYVFSKKWMKENDIWLKGTINYPFGTAYLIEFDQKDNIKKQLYKGKFLIDLKTYAIVSYEIEMSPKGVEYNEETSVLSFYLKSLSHKSKYQYTKIDNKWYLQYADIQGDNYCRIEKNLTNSIAFKEDFKNTDEIVSYIGGNFQLIFTNFNDLGKENFKQDEKITMKSYFSEDIKRDDKNIWGNFNIISPSDLDIFNIKGER